MDSKYVSITVLYKDILKMAAVRGMTLQELEAIFRLTESGSADYARIVANTPIANTPIANTPIKDGTCFD